jgi:hypothetical protein
MGWFRSRSGWGAYLALFALALQLALLFGHVHLEGRVAPGPGHVAAAGVDFSTAAVVDPAGKETPALADHYCPICALIHLAALAPPTAPALTRAIAFERVALAAAVWFDLTTPHYHTPLGARAPPIA